MSYLKTFYKKFREFFNIILWVALILVAPYAERYFDAGAAPPDLGALSAIFYGGAAVMIYKNLTWLLIKTIWPDLAAYISNELFADFKLLSRWEKAKICFLFYGSSVALMVLALRSFLR